MDKKYFIKGTFIQVMEGKELKVTFDKLTKKDLDLLVEADVLNVVEYSIIEQAIARLAKKAGITVSEMENFIYTLGCLNEWIAFKFLLKQVAIEIDRDYEGHISKCSVLYYVSSRDLSIEEMPTGFYNSDRISLFRSKEEAEKAVKCVREYLDCLLDEQED